jgi:hypothetical protein
MKKVLLAASAVALTVGGLIPLGVSPAAADPAFAATASGYGANANLAGTPLIDKAGLAQVTLPPGGDAGPKSLVLAPVAPVAISGTAVGTANAHTPADITTAIPGVPQAVPGPYNARGLGAVQGLNVLTGVPAPTNPATPGVGVSVVSAAAVRGEAVGVCAAGKPVYSAASEFVDLKIGGTTLPLNTPLTGLIGALDTALQPLAMVADIKQNEVVVNADGAAVNALHVTVLGGIGVPATTPVLDLTVGHAQVSGLSCTAPIAQCADKVDNDGDGLIDAKDPGCLDANGVYNPNDNDERNQCSDTIDNDGDGKIDFPNDPGCTSAQDNNETDPLPQTAGTGSELARTGGQSQAPLAGGLALFGLALLALRRRSVAGR